MNAQFDFSPETIEALKRYREARQIWVDAGKPSSRDLEGRQVRDDMHSAEFRLAAEFELDASRNGL